MVFVSERIVKSGLTFKSYFQFATNQNNFEYLMQLLFVCMEGLGGNDFFPVFNLETF